jgi:hypothetical protein
MRMSCALVLRLAGLAAGSLWLAGCASQPAPVPAGDPIAVCRRAPPDEPPPPGICGVLPHLTEATTPELLAKYGSTFEAYQREGGSWLALPVMVNEEFDFAIASAMEGIGPGVAAAKRVSNNEEKTRALAEVRLSDELLAGIDLMRRHGSAAYLVLWGSGSAKLRLVVEPSVNCPNRGIPEVVEGPERPLVGEGSWATPGVLDAAGKELLMPLVRAAGAPRYP